MHGGLSPELEDFSELKKMEKPHRNPHKGLLNDMMCADLDANIPFWRQSSRGSGLIFGPAVCILCYVHLFSIEYCMFNAV